MNTQQLILTCDWLGSALLILAGLLAHAQQTTRLLQIDDLFETYNVTYQEKIQKLRQTYDPYMPEICRKDLCSGDQTIQDSRLGNFTLPAIVVGTRAQLLCPFGPGNQTAPHVMFVSCLLDPRGAVVFDEINSLECNEPPVVIMFRQTASTLALNWEQKKFSMKTLDTLVSSCLSEPRGPITSRFITAFKSILSYTAWTHHLIKKAPSARTLVNLLQLVDYIGDLPYSQEYSSALQYLPWLLSHAELPPGWNYTGQMIQASHMTPETTDAESNGTSVSLPKVENGKQFLGILVSFFFDSASYFFEDVYDFPEESNDSTESATAGGTTWVNTTTTEPQILYSEAPGPRRKPALRLQLPVVLVQPYVTLAVVVPYTITFKFHKKVNASTSTCVVGQISQASEEGMKKRLSICKRSAFNSTHVTCTCMKSGIFAVFVQESDEPPDIGEFLGFPYIAELSVASHVLVALSVVCLLATCVTYFLFRRVRRGIPTQVLLHLCVSLILLGAVIYVCRPMMSSLLGCQVASAFLMYSILVSLMWNGAEAISMYLLLVKVFNTQIHKFMPRAIMLCWGGPAVVVGIAAAATYGRLAGRYIVDCERQDRCLCRFRCVMIANVMYWAFLLPMATIMLHNIVIFCLVLRVLRNQRKKPGSHRGWRAQLLGAFAMLVLLGVPWLLAAFAAVNPGEDLELTMAGGVFHIMFIVFVNLQGVFIFTFHCLRLPDVRNQWKQVLISRFSSSQSSLPSDQRADHYQGNQSPGKDSRCTRLSFINDSYDDTDSRIKV